jgi:very-short-patch-repair endonuclease
MQETVDPFLPDNWRKAWRLRRLATYLDSIDPKDGFKRLAKDRREIEGFLGRAYRDVVVKRTWLSLAENASPSIRAALQSYLAAIQRIGKGTGKRAVRFRQDARNAASQANPAVPCWIMPHYRISESLPPELGCFDLVIIDEASQSDLTALPALLRAKKVLVVGDDKQVSPEGVGLEEEKVRNLMSRFLGEQVETYRPQMDPSRSIYDLFKVVFATNSVMLKEHFRCVPPIIEYSKREFYNHELRPLRLPKVSERLDPPLIDVFVEDGYRKGDLNLPELRFIVDEIKGIVADPRIGSRSIGVVSLLADKQALAIWERLTDEIGPELMQRHQIACGDARTFQGKERDIMFLSMVSAPNDVGAPLVRDTFAQRFNVAASRARDRMYLVRSVAPENLSEADRLRRKLIAHFASPFPQDESRIEDLRKLCESPFEEEVYELLVNRGYRVTPQVKVGQYRIDMVVEGDNDARLAVECDGDKYHGADKWADDMRRQSDLERAGWSFWRCFASTFLRRREYVVADLLKTLSERGIEPLGIENGPRSVHSEQRVVSSAKIDTPEPVQTEQPDFRESLFTPAGANGVGEPYDTAAKHNFPISSSSNPAQQHQQDRNGVQSGVRPRAANSHDVASLMAYCQGQNLRVSDNRPKSGALWVVHLKAEGSTALTLKHMGLRYAEGKGWWMK